MTETLARRLHETHIRESRWEYWCWVCRGTEQQQIADERPAWVRRLDTNARTFGLR